MHYLQLFEGKIIPEIISRVLFIMFRDIDYLTISDSANNRIFFHRSSKAGGSFKT